jgi:protein-disulfide isomerase
MTAAQSRSIFGVTRTPALMVNDRVLVQGRVPEVEEIKQMLEQMVNPS